MSDFIKKFAGVFEWGIELWFRYKPSRVQRYASYVIVVGLSLVIISFNDLLFEYLLKPIGFARGGLAGPILGLLFTFIGLLTLVIDRVVDNLPSNSRQQDAELFQEILTIIPWSALNDFLNNFHNHWYWNTHYHQILNLCAFLEDEANEHVDKRLQKTLNVYNLEARSTLGFLAKNFTPQDKDMVRFTMLPNISVDNTGQHHPRYLEAANKVDAHIESLKLAYKSYVKVGRNLGFVKRSQKANRSEVEK